MPDTADKTFYLETFGCQMNVHDSEKVVGTLMQQGYRQVQTVEEAGLVLYNTCSIRDKAEQKVFNRLNDYKKYQKQGKKFGVLGCVAQQEGDKIFERAPYVSLVAGSASYRNLPQMLVQLEAGNSRVTGLDDRQTDLTFETEFTARTNPHRGYITIIEGCDKFCSYCIVPYTRGKERSRSSDSVLSEAHRMAEAGYTEIQLLGQHVNFYLDPSGRQSFAQFLAAVGDAPGIHSIGDEERSKRLAIILERKREIQRTSYCRHVGSIIDVMVEGKNEARGQWIGRTSQNKTLNFTAAAEKTSQIGSDHPIRVTASFPNSL